MAANEIHVDDFGTVFEVTLKDDTAAIDLSTTTTKEFWFRKPDKTKITKAVSFVSDGTDGKLTYTIPTGLLDTAGSWKLQAYIVNGAGEWHSDWGTFKVHANVGA